MYQGCFCFDSEELRIFLHPGINYELSQHAGIFPEETLLIVFVAFVSIVCFPLSGHPCDHTALHTIVHDGCRIVGEDELQSFSIV